MKAYHIMNLVFIIIGVSGAFFALYSVLIRSLRRELSKVEHDIILKMSKHAHTR